MSCHRAARVDNRHEVARRLDPSIAPPHIPDDPNVECFQQWTRRLQATSGVVVAGDDHRCHPWPSAAQPYKRVVEELLRLSRGVLAVEHVAGDDERVDVALNDDLF